MTEQNDNECGFFAEMSRLEQADGGLGDDLRRAIEGAFVVRFNDRTDERTVFCAWHGGTGVNVYMVTMGGGIREIDFFNMGMGEAPSRDEAIESIDEYLDNQRWREV